MKQHGVQSYRSTMFHRQEIQYYIGSYKTQKLALEVSTVHLDCRYYLVGRDWLKDKSFLYSTNCSGNMNSCSAITVICEWLLLGFIMPLFANCNQCLMSEDSLPLAHFNFNTILKEGKCSKPFHISTRWLLYIMRLYLVSSNQKLW